MFPATRRLLAAFAALPVAALFTVSPLVAANRYWDIDGTTAGSGPDITPDGAWNTNSWGTATGTAATTAWVNGDNAFFSADTDATGTYSITVDGGNHHVLGLFFENGTVTLANGTGTLVLDATATQIDVAASRTATITEQLTEALAGRGISKTDTGRLILEGDNTYTGETLISGGQLRIRHANALGTTAGGTTVQNGEALELQGGITVGNEALSIIGTGGGTGAIRNIGGTNIWEGPVTLAGAATIASDASTLTFQTAATSFTGTDTSLTIAGAGNIAISGAISTGTGSLIKNDAGALTLSGANTYTGATTLNGGTLILGAAERIADASALNVASGATFDLADHHETVGSLAGAGDVTLGTATLTSGGLGTSTTMSGEVSGTGGLTKTGAGTLTLSSANSYTGATTINDGTLSISSATALGTTAGGTTVASGASLELQGGITIGAEALSLTGHDSPPLRNVSGDNVWQGAVSISGLTTIASSSGTLTFNTAATSITGTDSDLHIHGAGNVTIAGPTAGIAIGSGNLIKYDAGTLTLTTARTYTGYTNIAAGVVNIRHASSLGITDSGTYVNSSAALELQGSITVGAEALSLRDTGIGGTGALRNISGDNVWQGAVTLIDATTIGSDSGTLTFDTAATSITGTNQNLTIAGSGNVTIAGPTTGIATGSGSLTKTGTGTLTLSSPSSYTGLTNISSGVVNIRNAASLGTADNGTTVSSGAALQIQGGITVGAETLYLSGTGVSSTGALRNISGDNVWQGAVNVAGATTTIASDSGTLTFNTAATSITGSTSLTIAGSGNVTIAGSTGIGISTSSLTKTGTGTLTLSSPSSYTGATTINSGVVNIRNASALGTTGSGTTVAGTAALQLQGGITVGSESLQLAGFGISGTGALRNISGDNIWQGAVILADQSAIQSDSGTLTFNTAGNSISGTGQTLHLGGSGNITIAGPITAINIGSAPVGKYGTGTLTISSASSYTGDTSLAGGTVAIGHANALGTSGFIGFGGGTLRYDGISTDLSSRFSTGSGQLYRIHTNGNDVTFGTALTSTGGSLVKYGSGNLTLTGNNTYNNGTVVDGGTLTLGRAGGTLSDSGTVEINSGGHLNVANSDMVGVVRLYGGIIDGSGTLTGSSYYLAGGSVNATLGTGAITVTSGFGTTTLGSAARFNSSSSLTLQAGQLTLGGNESVASYTHEFGILSGTGTLTSATTYDVRGGNIYAQLGGTVG